MSNDNKELVQAIELGSSQKDLLCQLADSIAEYGAGCPWEANHENGQSSYYRSGWVHAMEEFKNQLTKQS